MRKCIKEDGTPLSSSEKNKRYRQKKKQKISSEEKTKGKRTARNAHGISEWVRIRLYQRMD